MASLPPTPLVTNTASEHHLLLSHPVLLLLLAETSPPSSAPRFHLHPSSVCISEASNSNPSQMAILNLGCGSDDKENAPPPSATRGVAVKRQTMKRPRRGRTAPRRRPPLRDITQLFVAALCPPTSAVLLARSDAAALPEAARPGAGASDGVTMRQGSHSLRMGFR